MVNATVAHRFSNTLPLRHGMAQRVIQRNHATTNKMARSTEERSDKSTETTSKGEKAGITMHMYCRPMMETMAIMVVIVLFLSTQVSSKHIHPGRKPSWVQSCIGTARTFKTTTGNDQAKPNRRHTSWKRITHSDRAKKRRFNCANSDQAIEENLSTKQVHQLSAKMTDPFAYSANGIPLVNRFLQPITIRGSKHFDPDGNEYDYDENKNELRDVSNDLVQQPDNSVAIQVVVAAASRRTTAPMPAPAAMFALSPAHTGRQLIDYTTKEGIEMNKQATKSLYPEDKGFNLEPSEKFAFVGKLKARAHKQNWTEYLLTIPINGTNKCFLDHYGEISEDEVAIIAGTINATNDRLKQEQQQLYSCVHASLTTAAQQRIALQNDRTMDDPNGRVHQGKTPSGLALLKLVLTLSSADTRATTNVYFTKLNSGMQEIMESHGSNIVAFNDEIRLIQAELTARGEDAHKIVPQLFQVYEDVHKGEGKMGRYVELLSNQYTNGTDYTASQLMAQVEAKYRELTEAEDVQGKEKKDDDAKIVALQAQVRALTAQLQTKESAPQGGRNEDDETKELTENRKKQRALRRKLDRTPAPKEGEPHTMVIDGKTYYWCEGGNAHKPKWVVHKPSECRGRQASGTTVTPPAAISEVATTTAAAGFLATAAYQSDEDADFAES